VFCYCFKEYINEEYKGLLFTYERAPEPSDIYWQNLGIPLYERLGRGAVSLFGTSIIMGICIGVIDILKSA
jgi:hypothetical protein